MLKVKQLGKLEGPEKPRKARKHFDSRGLYLLVTDKGARYWRFRYHFDRKEKVLALGVYPDVGLADARDKREDARKLLGKGIDPNAQRKADTRARLIASEGTFRAVAEEWLEAGCPGAARSKGPPTESTIGQLRQRLTKYVYPRVGHRPMIDITLADLRCVISPISKKELHETAHRIRSLCERIYGYAIATERAERNIAADLRYTISPIPKTKGFAAIIKPKPFGDLLRAIDGYEGHMATMSALKLAPLVFVRPGELRMAEWEEVDIKEKKWSIPDHRMKEGQPHNVPLSQQAIEIIKGLHQLTGRGKYLFPSIRSAQRPMSDNTLNAALRRLGYDKKQMTVHGFRKSAATMLADLGYSKEWVETQLAHKRPGVEGIYNKAHLLEQRTKMMQDWADYLDEIKAAK